MREQKRHLDVEGRSTDTLNTTGDAKGRAVLYADLIFAEQKTPFLAILMPLVTRGKVY